MSIIFNEILYKEIKCLWDSLALTPFNIPHLPARYLLERLNLILENNFQFAIPVIVISNSLLLWFVKIHLFLLSLAMNSWKYLCECVHMDAYFSGGLQIHLSYNNWQQAIVSQWTWVLVNQLGSLDSTAHAVNFFDPCFQFHSFEF